MNFSSGGGLKFNQKVVGSAHNILGPPRLTIWGEVSHTRDWVKCREKGFVEFVDINGSSVSCPSRKAQGTSQEEKQKDCKSQSSGLLSGSVFWMWHCDCLLDGQQVRLSALDLHKIKSATIPAWMKERHRSLGSYWQLIAARGRRVHSLYECSPYLIILWWWYHIHGHVGSTNSVGYLEKSQAVMAHL